jgi:hypothetical protein
MDSNSSFFTNDVPLTSRSRKNHIPICDVDDLSFKNRHDPKFIAEISMI